MGTNVFRYLMGMISMKNKEPYSEKFDNIYTLVSQKGNFFDFM